MDQKRQYPRFPFKEAIGYQANGDAPLSGGLSADIGEGGVRIRVQEFIPLRTVLSLKVHLTDPARTVPVRGQVVWVREVPHSESTFDVGIKFLEEEPKDPALGEYFNSRRYEF